MLHLRWTKISFSFIFYRPQRSWGKVIFSQASVTLSKGGGSTWAGTPPGTRCPPDQVHPPGLGTPPGPDTPPRAVHAGRYGQQAGGTHPTGMHSCCLRNNQYFSNCILHVVFFYFRILARIHSCHHAIYKASTSK